MSNVTRFLLANKIKTENLKYVASKSFVDEEGNPLEWEIRKVTAEEDDALRADCTKRVAVNVKRGQYRDDFDADKYIAKLCVACTVEPNLNVAELQDSYGVKTPESLLRRMLDSGEYTEYKSIVLTHNGFDVGMDDKVEEAKNL